MVISIISRAGLAATILVLGAASPALAEAPPDAPRASLAVPAPRVHHAPLSSARAHEDLRISAFLDHPELVRGAFVVYRVGADPVRQVPLLRSEGRDDAYLAVVPAGDVMAPGLTYSIEIERTDGARVAAFASREDPQPVLVIDDHTDVHERAALRRLGNRRSVISASADYVRFGTTTAPAAIPCAAGQTACTPGQLVTPSVADQYWRVETGYTYRPLRTVAEFGIKIGVVRGTSLVPLSQADFSRYSVGLNYAEPWIRFRIADAWHLELSGLASITEIGFSVGGGAALLIGDPYGTRLTLGAETIGFSSTYFGSRFYTRLDILVREGFTVAPVVEVTDMPHAESFGVRLYGDASLTLPRGFGLGLRAGYQARDFASGGVSAGSTVSYAF